MNMYLCMHLYSCFLGKNTVGMSGSIGSIRILSIIGVVNNPELMLQVTGCFSCQPLAASR